MIPGSEGPTDAGSTQGSGDTTIELVLSEEQRVALLQADAAAQLASSQVDAAATAVAIPNPVPRVAANDYQSFASRRSARVDFVCNMTFAVLTLVIVAAVAWPTSSRRLPTPTRAALAHLASLVPQATAAAAAAEPQGTPVRITNAFDRTEVFEFPPGTSELQARHAVEEVLMGRARERIAERLALKRANTVRSERGAALQPPEIFVTKLLAGTKDPLSN
jgi:hypothetical protein